MSIFKKKTKITPPKTMTTRLYDLYGEQPNLDYLEWKIDNIPIIDTTPFAKKNEVNEFRAEQKFHEPVTINKGYLNSVQNTNTSLVNKKYVDDKVASIPTPNLSNVARTNTTNTFTNRQTIQHDLVVKNPNNSTSQLRFEKSDGSRVIEMSIDGNNLKIKNPIGDVKFDVPSSKSINFSGQRLTGVGTPTADDHSANKKYVDDKVASIPPVDLTDINRRINDNTGEIRVLNSTVNNINSDIEGLTRNVVSVRDDYNNYKNNIGADKSYVEYYVKNNSINLKNSWADSSNIYQDCNWKKWDLTRGSNIYAYIITISRDQVKNMIERAVGSSVAGRKFLIQIKYMEGSRVNTTVQVYVPVTKFYGFGNVQIHERYNSDIMVTVISGNDMYPGSTPNFTVNTKINMSIIEV